MAAIELRGLTKVYPGGVKALDSLDLTVPDGEFFALLGPSGCGKTTLLRTIAGLETATGGAVVIGDRDVTGVQPGGRDIAMVFQDYALFPHMDVTDNIAYPLRIKKVAKAARRDKAAEVAARLGLEHLMDRRPGQLSGGQQQRVALARVMATQAQAFLFDEPLSNLDARLRLEARTFLKKLQRELGVTTVFVTHDQAEALAMADRMAVMEAGHIRQIGTPAEVFQRPANTFVAGFIGSTPMNLLDGTVRGDTLDVAGFEVSVPVSAEGRLSDGEKIVYGVRPEYLAYSAEPAKGALSGRVVIVENLGASHLVTLDANDVTVQAVVPEGSEPAIGDTGHAVPRRDRALVYRDGELV
ncbi:ATP-binding cassette domain-containing protein [Nonomuraea phyllanthi]|uniref:ATP-binding cassette domain-containing protein n=1 Tax=Nonomuraea phyllanthi TaxID=2219224 RepID=A0A5C4WTX1_9ACTN|nr:ABC transporter ATP-binding protein [Nonomuraea phyllanthi]KAB8197053.1 ATP-binding cassette domain-containing protein [Nonomuraea phyllanthi]QFY06946.1 ATP-binding cassette domain-containing protein [Nonomuraea phyllanthi]